MELQEYYDQYGSFSQEQWSQSLYEVLKKAGGLLHTKLETYKAAKELVAGLDDRYSSFLNPEQYRFALHRPVPSELKYLAYQYTGVGIELGRRFSDGRFTIVAPFAGSPAEEAGILAGEELVSVNGISTQTLTVDEAATLMRGPIGSVVDLEVQSPEGRPRSLLIERRALPLPPLKEQIIDVGNGKIVLYLRLHYFTHEGTRRMASAIRGGESLGVDGYVLDLRNNPGGVFEEAISMAALWLDCDSCNIAETVRSNTSDIEDLVYSVGALPLIIMVQKEIFAKHPGALTHSPLLLITNRSSASASEVLAGALHDNKRAIIVGEKTFGKGVVQYYFPMDDGSGLKLTVAKYLTPSRYDITKMGGLLPDKPCKDYPHGKGRLDECIESALHELMKGMEKLEGKKPKILGPLPFRWMSFSKTMVHHFDIN